MTSLVPPAANSEYYKLLMSHCLAQHNDATVYPLEELESITSEHALKNTVGICRTKVHTYTFIFISPPKIHTPEPFHSSTSQCC